MVDASSPYWLPVGLSMVALSLAVGNLIAARTADPNGHWAAPFVVAGVGAGTIIAAMPATAATIHSQSLAAAISALGTAVAIGIVVCLAVVLSKYGLSSSEPVYRR